MSYNVPRFLTETSDQSFPITILDFGQSTIIHIVRFYTSDVKTERLSPVFMLYELNDELKDIKRYSKTDVHARLLRMRVHFATLFFLS